jgi:hypothetical protein
VKALTLTQPWATLVAIGAKAVETRSWSTSHRGDLAIHAAKGFPAWARRLCWQGPFAHALIGAGYTTWQELPVGEVVAEVQLVDVVPTISIRFRLSEQELAFGDYGDGRFAWVLKEPVRQDAPVPVRGALGLWEWR